MWRHPEVLAAIMPTEQGDGLVQFFESSLLGSQPGCIVELRSHSHEDGDRPTNAMRRALDGRFACGPRPGRQSKDQEDDQNSSGLRYAVFKVNTEFVFACPTELQILQAFNEYIYIYMDKLNISTFYIYYVYKLN